MTKNLKGKVTMDLSEYNKMIEMITRYENMFEVTNNYGKQVRLKVSLRGHEEEIIELVRSKFPEAEMLQDAFDPRWNYPEVNVAVLPDGEEEES